jgi:hypothetical protein
MHQWLTKVHLVGQVVVALNHRKQVEHAVYDITLAMEWYLT